MTMLQCATHIKFFRYHCHLWSKYKQAVNSPRIDWVKWNLSSSQHNLQVKNSWMLAITLHLKLKIPLQETPRVITLSRHYHLVET